MSIKRCSANFIFGGKDYGGGKGLFIEFLSAVAPEHQAFVEALHNRLTEQGCALAIKEARSGYAASYLLDKNTVINWVFRKSGILARIYGDYVGSYEAVLAFLPADMQKQMTASRDCNRWIDPNNCSSTCVKGFVYALDGVVYKKCRNDGMFFLLIKETAGPVAALACSEAAARKTAS